MTRHRTGTSSSYGDFIQDDTNDGPLARARQPGLVLLYAPNFDQFHPAYVFGVDELIIGREVTASICVPEQAVSRQHARLQSRDGTRWTLTDLGSRNGTMVNGRYVQEVELDPFDEVRIGDAVFKFVSSGAALFAPYRIDGEVAGGRRAKVLRELVGGYQMDSVAADVERIAPTSLSCVVLGETGTGKEVVARGIHRASGRRGSFQAVNCAAIPHNLLESELFGYRRGAFSGADRDKPGLVKLADGGTLFLDEIGDMPLEAQTRLLRVLQAREVFPLGGTTAEKVDIRVVCATHRDLTQLVREGRFRGDLFARLNEHAVRLPPLRERKEDMIQLARSFTVRHGRPSLQFTFSFLVALLHYDWPFNVRELESCIKRGIALLGTEDAKAPLDTQHLPDSLVEEMKTYGERKPAGHPSLLPSVEPPTGGGKRGAPTADELREMLSRHGGNVAAVGRELGKERMQVHRWLKKYGIDLGEYR